MGPASKTSSNTVLPYGEVDANVKLKPKESEGGNRGWGRKQKHLHFLVHWSWLQYFETTECNQPCKSEQITLDVQNPYFTTSRFWSRLVVAKNARKEIFCPISDKRLFRASEIRTRLFF